MPQPAVAIIVPAYNDEAWIAAALESCISQTFADIEVICVDDASTDGTRTVIESYRARDARIRLVEFEENRSAFQARRAGIEAASAPYVMFLDGDDELAPNAVEVAIERARATGADVVGMGVEFVMSEGVSKPAFEKDLQPKHQELLGSEIVTTLFPPGKAAHGHVWGYLFAREVIDRAYDGFSYDRYIGRANDLPIAFLALASASKYASSPQRAYRYFFRRGVSGQKVRNADDFAFYLGAVGSIDLIAEKLNERIRGLDESEEVLASYESTRLYVIGTVLRYALGAIDENLQQTCFAMLCDQVSSLDVVRAAAAFCTDALQLFPVSETTRGSSGERVRSVLIATAQLGTGGIQGVIASQAQHLVNAGMRVTIAVQRPVDSVYNLPEGVEVIHIGGATFADRLASWVEICRASAADVVIDHYILYSRAWPFFALAAQTLGIPTIGFLQSFSLRPLRDDNANTSFLVQNLPHLKTVVTLSTPDVAFWKLQGIQHVVYLPHPPSPMLVENAVRAKPKAAPRERVKLVWWGRLQQSTKQVRDLIPITAALRARGVDAELTIIGPDSSDLSAARLLADARALGVTEFVNIPGELHGQALVDALSDAHVYVLTSIIEGSPLALLEAQSLGLPVAMYELPWLANLDGNAGVMAVKQGDVRGMARQLDLMVNDPDLYVSLSAGSLEAAQRGVNFNFEALYTELLNGELSSGRSPEPTLSDAQLLIKWAVFYTEINAKLHTRQGAQIAALRRQVDALRKDLTTTRGKFLRQRRTTAELRRQLESGRRMTRIGRRARRALVDITSKLRTILRPTATAQELSPTLGRSSESSLPRPAQPARTGAAGDVTRRVDANSARSESSVGPVVRARGERPTPRVDVSVIIPVFNAEPWLEECLSSVLRQRDVSIEVICINDGSTDDSARILSLHAGRDARVRIIDQPNSGQSVGRNAGIAAATGRYMVFLDSDDFWSQDALARLVRHADADELDILLFEGHSVRDGEVSDEIWRRYGNYYPRSGEYDQSRSGAQMIADMRRGRDYRAHVGLYLTRTTYAHRIGAKFVPGIVHQDNPYTFALLLQADRVAHVKIDLYARRLRPGSTITTLKAANSAKGYYLSYVSMLRDVSNRDLPPQIANVLSNIVYEVFVSSLEQFVKLPASIGAELKRLDPSPEAQVAFRMLVASRDMTLAQPNSGADTPPTQSGRDTDEGGAVRATTHAV